jgi:hypothetical protein
MILALQSALHARLAGTAAVTTELGTIAGVAAIITERPVPPDTPSPYAVIGEALSNTPMYDTKTTEGSEVLTDIGIYDVRKDGAARVERIAKAVRDAIHRKPLAVDGYGNLVASVTGPIGAPVDNMHGRIVTVRTVLMQK